MDIQSVHHVAYRCKDARQTVDFYSDVLGLPYTFCVAGDRHYHYGDGEKFHFIHLFFQMEDGGFLAFFELPGSPPMGKDPNTPEWVQHLAFKVKDMATLNACKEKIEAEGVEVLGPIDHTICQSIYFFDPNGHRLELAVDTTTPEMVGKLVDAAHPWLEEWDRTKQAPKDSDWIHRKELDKLDA